MLFRGRAGLWARWFVRVLHQRADRGERPQGCRPIHSCRHRVGTTVREKVTHYLLVPQARGDKSGLLELAGFTAEHAEQLLRDLREQLRFEAVPTKSNKFGQ